MQLHITSLEHGRLMIDGYNRSPHHHKRTFGHVTDIPSPGLQQVLFQLRVKVHPLLIAFTAGFTKTFSKTPTLVIITPIGLQ